MEKTIQRPGKVVTDGRPIFCYDSFKRKFREFSIFGEEFRSDGTYITLSQSDMWMKQAKVFDSNITPADTAIYLKPQSVAGFTILEYMDFLDDLATAKNVDVHKIMIKMSDCGAPGSSNEDVIESTDGVEDKTMEKSPQNSGTTAAAGGVGAGTGLFSANFKAFSKFGDIKSDGKHITLSQSDKWMKQAKVFDKKITTTDTGIHFKKQKSMKLTMEQYKTFLDDLTKSKKVDLNEIMGKMANCGAPGLSSAVGAVAGKASSAVERLTDVSKYTGAHKHRFDESGKGKGIAGRKDVPDSSGYVHGYQQKDTNKK